VRGWTSYVDATVSPHTGVHRWSGEWRNQKGDVVTYTLQYTSTANELAPKQPLPENSALQVTELLIPAAQAQEMAAYAKKMKGK
jgi:hypothetical protein